MNCQYCRLSTGVQVADRDCLVLIGEILDNALGEDIKGSTKENVVGRVANDVDLEVECDIANQEGNIMCETKGFVDFSVGRLHIEDHLGIVDESELVADTVRHRYDLRARVDDAFNKLLVVDERND